MRFSPHFKSTEYEKQYKDKAAGKWLDDAIPKKCHPIFTEMSEDVMEPIREKYGLVIITSGYRSPNHNHAIGGKPTSQHIATAEFCACDFMIPGADLSEVFDWLRLQARLPIDQLILEYGQSDSRTPACIHVSYSKTPRYEALEGLTHNRSPYTARAFNAPTDVSA